jgi:DNA polymerase III epsilon subunit-like protein
MSYIAVDVETANENLASICQIGVVEYVGASTHGSTW